MATGGKDRDARAARERSRLYQARRDFHEGQARRRTRDNLIAGIAGGVLIVGLIASQTVYFAAGPGAPSPTPTPTPTGMTPSPTTGPTDSPAPAPTSDPTPTADPTATPTPAP